jgi:probable HAF family extracellular repeat protein
MRRSQSTRQVEKLVRPAPARILASLSSRRSLITAFVVATLATTRMTLAQVEYTVTDLGSGNAFGINDSGQVVGTTNGSAFLYSNDSLQILGSGVADGINASGEVVGYTSNDQAFLYSNGSLQELGTLGGPTSYALGINDSGQIVGQADVSTTVFDAFLYDNGSMNDLGIPGSGDAINNTGQITGQERGVGAFLYSNGSSQLLDVVGGAGAAINSSGQVVGNFGAGPSGSTEAFLHSNGSIQGLGTLGGYPSFAQGINDNGVIVGSSQTSSGTRDAFVDTNGSISDLNNYINPALGWSLTSANAINDAGQIVGQGTNSSGATHAFLLTPYIVTQHTNQTPPVVLTNLPVPGDLLVLNKATGQFVAFSSTPGTVGYVDPTKPTEVLTHGFASSPSLWTGANPLQGFAENLADIAPTANIVAWNWSANAGTLSDPLTLAAATYNTQEEGLALGTDLAFALGTSYQNSLHFIGHSLGTLVNAEAIDTFASKDSSANIQDTLFDEAGIADTASGIVVGQTPPFSAIPAPGTTTAIDNYISAVGSLHSQAVNIILTQGPTIADPIDFHGYPVNWYQGTIENSDPSLMGLGAQFNGTQAQPGQNFLQANPLNQYSLTPVLTAVAQATLDARDVLELNNILRNLTVQDLTGTVLVAGNVAVNTVTLPPDSLSNGSSELGPQVVLSKGSSVPGPSSLAESSTTSSHALQAQTQASASSYVWIPISIPSDAKTMSFDITFSDLSQDDFLSVGVNNTLVCEIESQFISNGKVTNSGDLDISLWSGQNTQLFFGLNASDDNNLGGTITIDDIQFQSVPEPASLLLILGIAGTFCSRRPQRR